MSDQFTASAPRLDQVLIGLQELGTGARNRLAMAIGIEAIEFERVVKDQKLSGQVLNRRTSALADSVFSEVTNDAGGVIATIGANTPYSRAQEYGATILPTNGEFLKFQIDGRWVQVRQVVLPERSYLRSTLAERADIIRDELTRAVAGAA
jgi:phage gpG-like protein